MLLSYGAFPREKIACKDVLSWPLACAGERGEQDSDPAVRSGWDRDHDRQVHAYQRGHYDILSPAVPSDTGVARRGSAPHTLYTLQVSLPRLCLSSVRMPGQWGPQCQPRVSEILASMTCAVIIVCVLNRKHLGPIRNIF